MAHGTICAATVPSAVKFCPSWLKLFKCDLLQDMAPYVPLLVPELRSALVDPLPEVRATAARALRSLIQGMGATHFKDLIPWLLATLKSEVRPAHEPS